MSTLSHAASSAEKRTNARYWIVVMLFIVTSFNYGDRATLSIAGSEMAKDIGLIRWAWVTFSPHSHGPTSSGKFQADGFWTVLALNVSISGPSLSGLHLPFCRALSMFSTVLALSSRSLRCASW